MQILIAIFAILHGMLFTDFHFTGSVEVNGSMHRSDPIGNVYVIKSVFDYRFCRLCVYLIDPVVE